MKVLNWGIPTRGSTPEPGDLVSSKINDDRVVGLFVRDEIGDAILIFAGWRLDDEKAPYLVSADAMDAPLSKVDARLAVKPTSDLPAFTSSSVYPMKVGQLLVTPDGDFGVMTLFRGSRVAFSLQTGLPITRLGDAERYNDWALIAILPDLREPVEIFRPS